MQWKMKNGIESSDSHANFEFRRKKLLSFMRDFKGEIIFKNQGPRYT